MSPHASFASDAPSAKPKPIMTDISNTLDDEVLMIISILTLKNVTSVNIL